MAELPRIVVCGGGIAAGEFLLALHALAPGRARVALVAPSARLAVPALRVGEPFAAARAESADLRELAGETGTELRPGVLAEVEPVERRVRLADGATLPFDYLVVAVGARPEAAFTHALTFFGDERADALRGVLADLEEGWSRSVAFVVPGSATWPLPAYELALLTAAQVRGMGEDVAVSIVTPEETPLAIFGVAASEAVAGLLEEAGITFVGGGYASPAPGVIHITPGVRQVRAERVVALPRLVGPEIPGLPATVGGFIPVDQHGRVRGLDGVYAAGDGTDVPIKQGGIAAQLADAVADHVAAALGAPVEPHPFRPVLRGKLLTGGRERFLRQHGSAGGESRAQLEPLWWPPSKVSARHLGPWLTRHDPPVADPPPGIEVEQPLLEARVFLPPDDQPT